MPRKFTEVVPGLVLSCTCATSTCSKRAGIRNALLSEQSGDAGIVHEAAVELLSQSNKPNTTSHNVYNSQHTEKLSEYQVGVDVVCELLTDRWPLGLAAGCWSRSDAHKEASSENEI